MLVSGLKVVMLAPIKRWGVFHSYIIHEGL